MKSDNLIILKFDAIKPPTFKEKKGKDFVMYGNESPWSNKYPDFLIDLYNQSSIHNAIINGKSKYIVGQGLKVTKEFDLATSTIVEGWLSDLGGDGSFNLLSKVVKDRELFNGFAVQPIWNKKKDKVSLFHIDFSKVRISPDEETYYYTSDWKSRRPENNEDYKIFKAFNPNKKEKDTLIYYREYSPSLKYYPLPSYQAGINYINADIDISTFVASNTANGFNGGTLINTYNGEPTEDAKGEIEKGFKDKFSGSDKAGSIVISFNGVDSKGTEIIPLSDNGQDERFINLNEQVRQSIFTSHEATNPVLFGVQSAGGMGNNADEIRTASEHLQNMYVTPRQRVFIELFNDIAILNGWGKCFDIQNLEPIKAQLSEQTLLQVLTNDEIRAIAGYQPIEKKTFSKESKHSEFYKALELTGYTDDELELVEENFIDYNPFTFSLTAIDKDILGLIVGNPKVTLSELISLSGYESKELIKILKTLQEEGLIIDNGKNFQPANNEKKSELITVYKYAERPFAPPLQTHSREFCSTLMIINRNYTREQINTLSNQFGTDVWKNRGGFYNNPKTKVKTPYCRHIWKSKTVKLKT